MSMNSKSVRTVALAGILVVFWFAVAFANSCHGGGNSSDHENAPVKASKNKGISHNHMAMMGQRPVQSVEIDGTRISLDVMDMGMHVHMQEMKQQHLPGTFDAKKSHAIMVMLKNLKSKEVVSDSTVSVTVVSPEGEIKTGNAPWYGDHYGESFSPSKGEYRIRVKAVDETGKIREAEFKYEKI